MCNVDDQVKQQWFNGNGSTDSGEAMVNDVCSCYRVATVAAHKTPEGRIKKNDIDENESARNVCE